MKKKIKKILKNRLFIFIITALLFSVVGVSAATYFESGAVTYDNTESGLTSTNVQGAIDELYDACKIPSAGGNGILEKTPIVTTGDGLYEDEYEDGRYFYKGVTPNNYINFNNETWRIISIERDGRIKIIRNAVLDEYMAWDTDGNDLIEKNWAKPCSLNTYLNNDYLNTIIEKYRNKIFTSDWGIGTISDYNNNDLANQIKEENSKTWNGKIGLISVSEYLRASTNTSKCGTFGNYTNNYSECAKANWLYIQNYYYAVISQSKYYDYYHQTKYVIPFVYVNGELHLFSADVDAGVRPTLYLSSEVQITGGTGSQSDPYTIE